MSTQTERSTAKGLTYSFGVCQLVVMAGMVLFFPAVGVETFVFTPAVENGTLALRLVGQGEVHHIKLLMGLPCLATSFAVTAFVSSTYSLTESGTLNDDLYNHEQMHEGNVAVWDAIFWFVVTMVHAVAVFAVTTPVDVFAGCGCVYLLVYFLKRICAPIDREAGASMTTANANIAGFATGLLLLLYCTPASYTNRYTVAFVLGVLDYFLAVGHTWDKGPGMDTVANCRLFWACSCTLCMAGLYGAWHDELLTQFTSSR